MHFVKKRPRCISRPWHSQGCIETELHSVAAVQCSIADHFLETHVSHRDWSQDHLPPRSAAILPGCRRLHCGLPVCLQRPVVLVSPSSRRFQLPHLLQLVVLLQRQTNKHAQRCATVTDQCASIQHWKSLVGRHQGGDWATADRNYLHATYTRHTQTFNRLSRLSNSLEQQLQLGPTMISNKPNSLCRHTLLATQHDFDQQPNSTLWTNRNASKSDSVPITLYRFQYIACDRSTPQLFRASNPSGQASWPAAAAHHHSEQPTYETEAR